MPQSNTQDPDNSSFLSDVIKESQGTTNQIPTNDELTQTPPISVTDQIGNSNGGDSVVPPPKKPRKPLPPGTILKVIGALFFTGIVFFASFLAYIVFNPGEAQFFISMFGIDTVDIANLLRRFINGSFGIIMLVLSIVWFVVLFRAFWTPKEQKRKKMLAWMSAALVGILLFSLLTFWIFLFNKIGEIVWDGGVINIYDNTLYTNPLSASQSEITNTQNIIGPITLRYDIRGNARSYENNGTIQIDRYEINFDGAICGNGRSIITGSDPKTEQTIICTFDRVRNYNIRGTYFGKDINGQATEILIDLDPVEVKGLIDIREQQNSSGEDIVTLDASTLSLLGDPRWVYESSGDEVKSPNITVQPSETPTFISLKLFGSARDRVFLIQKKGILQGSGAILFEQSSSNPLDYTFSLSGITQEQSTILDIEWTLNEGNIICKNANEICEYTFPGYGKYRVSARLFLADKTTRDTRIDITVEKPLTLVRRVIVTGSNGKRLNPSSVYDPVLNSYLIDGIVPPEQITLDARDVVVENPGYQLQEVRWMMTDGKDILEKVGERITLDIANADRYTITATYIFAKNIAGTTPDIKKATDTIIINVANKNLIPRLNIIQSSDYVPVTITVDASESWSEDNEIIKFVYNFGEGKADAVGDAIQRYVYNTPGEKVILLTIVDDSGERAQLKKTLVLKEAPKIIGLMPSISPGIIGMPIDFSATEASGQVESYTWSFSDNTPTQRGMSVTHIFKSAGTYTITLTAIYTNGTQQQATQEYTVTTGLE